MGERADLTKRVIVVAGVTLAAASPFLMSFLGKWESGRTRVLVVYADKLAQNIPTVCNGITRHVTTTPIIVGQRWSVEKCELEEQLAVARMQRQLAGCFKVGPPQSVFDMATSHAWNNGAGNTCASQAMKAWNAGNWELGCQRLSKSDGGQWVWVYTRTGRVINGKPEMVFRQGLANRRADETKTCAEGLA